MTINTVDYNTQEDAKLGGLEGSPQNILGWEPLKTYFETGLWHIDWALPDDDAHSSNLVVPLPEEKTTNTFTKERATTARINLTDVDDITGESVIGEFSIQTPGPTQNFTTTPQKITQFDTLGEIQNVTVENGEITVLLAGRYTFKYIIYFTGDINTTYIVSAFRNGTQALKTRSASRILASSQIGLLTMEASGRLDVGDVIDFRGNVQTGTGDFTAQAGIGTLIKVR